MVPNRKKHFIFLLVFLYMSAAIRTFSTGISIDLSAAIKNSSAGIYIYLSAAIRNFDRYFGQVLDIILVPLQPIFVIFVPYQ